jgi:hypothetical protein
VDVIELVQHRGRELLHLRCGRGTKAESAETLSRLVEILHQQEPGSVRLLVDLSEASYWPSIALRWQMQQDLLASRCSRVAMVGVAGLIRTAVDIFLRVAQSTGRHPLPRLVTTFDDAQMAKDWLAADAAPSEDTRWATTLDAGA